MTMIRSARRLARERRTLEKMVALFCAAHHAANRAPPCAECRIFLDYAETRLRKCPYGALKPTCANCPVHCYKPARRAQVKAIMRYAGPRMLVRHPLFAIAHQLDGLRRARHPRELTRAERRRLRNA